MQDKFGHARGWLRKAESDLSATKHVLESGGPYDTACFHAQQAVEKYLKGLLALSEQPIPRTHDLQELHRLGAALGALWPLAGIDVAKLTPYAVELRYDFEFWPDRRTAQQALDLAEKVRNLVLAAVPKNVHP